MTPKKLKVLEGTNYRANVTRESGIFNYYYVVQLEEPVFDTTNTYITDWDVVNYRTLASTKDENKLEEVIQVMLDELAPSLQGIYYNHTYTEEEMENNGIRN